MPARNKTPVGPLDSVIILILACMVVLIVLWISSQIWGSQKFEKLPDWVTKAASSGWAYLTGGASSTLLARARWQRSAPRPNYLIWILGTVIAMLIIVFGVGAVLPVPPFPQTALLRFSLNCDARDHPNLSFLQKYPSWRDAHTIGPESDGHYQEYVDFPGQNGWFYARVVRTVTASQSTEDPLSQVTELCFKRNPKPPSNNAPREVRMECSEGKRCSLSGDDPGWVNVFSPDRVWAPGVGLVPVVFADSSKVQPGWKVPSLETLRKMTDRERVGYTEFLIKSTELSGLTGAESVQYLIKSLSVNNY